MPSLNSEEEAAGQLSRTQSTVVNTMHAPQVQPDEVLTQANFEVCHLPLTPYASPLAKRAFPLDNLPRVVYNTFVNTTAAEVLSFENAGPHNKLHFNPEDTVVGIVSCGGLCPGLNDVIRAIALFSLEAYGVKRVIGFKYGWLGLMDEGLGDAIELTTQNTRDMHRFGGSFLGSSRGRPVQENGEEMVDNLLRLNVGILFALGGDGTLKGASALHDYCQKRGADISIIGIPKTIDNDVCYVQKTFGFETAVNEAVMALNAAQAEARSHKYGIGLVKLMGRHSGFVAAQAAVAFGSVHIVLIPENEITLAMLYQLIEARFKRKKYCTIVVAEGFGQSLMASSGGKDASGNQALGDIGIYLKQALEKWLKSKYEEYTVKYIDPSYMVRSCSATTNDAAFCLQLANHAVHEGMHGSSDCLIGYWNNVFTVVPIQLCISKRKTVNIFGDLWRAVREITVSLHERRARRVSVGPPPLA
eukprot:NODE_1302_length_1558_cov_25.643606_g1230_i0.p1 GENE.NODE_1302_length_1558_cov_25.643606_g1230_i0~~NODE_1302_length_1558_cov_25.643606_g1230_i0.p1  ORF type:complete len:491 (-),score=144.25 NODE_1302_length_1558_cov_25.643606_g1230_i0:85-1503(-)